MSSHAISDQVSPSRIVLFWSPKGGSGTSVAAALCALAAAEQGPTVLVDACGDQAGIFAFEGSDVGFIQWLTDASTLPPSALGRLARPLSSKLSIITSGVGETPQVNRHVVDRLRSAFSGRTVIVDAGVVRSSNDNVAALVDGADLSVMVLRNCYLAARRAMASDLRRDGLVVMEEPARALDATDIGEALDAPVLATMRWDASLARSVDAGRLKKVPRSARSIGGLLGMDLPRAS